MRPDCIILDEPTAMLDPKGREEVMNIIKKLNNEGITIVLITHFMDEAAKAHRVIIMDGGKVKLDGPPWEVFQRQEEIKAFGLDLPFAAELANRLRGKGFNVPGNIIDIDEMVEYLCL